MSGHEPMTVPVEPLTLAWRQAHVREAERALVEAERAGTGHHYGQGMLWCAIAQAHAAIANTRASELPRTVYRGGPVLRDGTAIIGEVGPEHRYGMPDRDRRPGA